MPRTALAVLLAAAAPAAAADWPQWLGPDRAAEWDAPALPAGFPPGGPKVEWRAAVGMGYSGPAVAGGKVYLTDRRLDAGQANPDNPFDNKTEVGGVERVLCFDAATGGKVWEHAYPRRYRISYAAGPRCTPTVDGDRVYALGAMGDLLCLGAADGKVRWQHDFLKEFDATLPVWGFSSHPLVDGDNLICMVGGTDGRLVMAFDKHTGAERWRALSFESGDWGYHSPVIYEFGGRRQLIVWHPRAVVGLDPATGGRLWAHRFDEPVKAALTAPTPRRAGDRLVLTAFYDGATVLRVGAAAADVVWRNKVQSEMPDRAKTLNAIMPTPAVRGGHIYGVSSYGELKCLELDTGKVVWQTNAATRGPLTPDKVRSQDRPSTGPPWNERWANAFLVHVSGERFVLFNEQGELILADLSPAGYMERARAQVVQPTNRMSVRPRVVWTHPAFAGGRVFVRNDDELVCVRLAD